MAGRSGDRGGPPPRSLDAAARAHRARAAGRSRSRCCRRSSSRPSNLSILVKHVAINAILAIGMTFVILSGGIDLSVGSIAGLCGIVAGGLLEPGTRAARVRRASSTSTPGSWWRWRSLAGMAGRRAQRVAGRAPRRGAVHRDARLAVRRARRRAAHLGGATFPNLAGSADLGNTGFPRLGTASAARAARGRLGDGGARGRGRRSSPRYTPFGRQVYAVGGNERAALLAGVRVGRVKLLVYVISGFCSALVGLIIAAQLGAAHPATGADVRAERHRGRRARRDVADGRARHDRRHAHRRVRHRRARRRARPARRVGVLADGRQGPRHRARRRPRPVPEEVIVMGPRPRSASRVRASSLWLRGPAVGLFGVSSGQRAGDREPVQADRRHHAVARQPVLQGRGRGRGGPGARTGLRASLVNAHDDDANKQDQLIDVAIARKVAAIVLDNAGADASVAAVAQGQGGRHPEHPHRPRDQRHGRRRRADRVEQLPGRDARAPRSSCGCSGEKGSYIELVGRESDTNAAVRSRGFHDVLDKYPDLKLVARQSANWDQREAFQKIETLHPGQPRHQGRHRRQRHDGARRDGRAEGRRPRPTWSSSASTAARTPSRPSRPARSRPPSCSPPPTSPGSPSTRRTRSSRRARPGSRRSSPSTANWSRRPTPAQFGIFARK